MAGYPSRWRETMLALPVPAGSVVQQGESQLAYPPVLPPIPFTAEPLPRLSCALAELSARRRRHSATVRHCRERRMIEPSTGSLRQTTRSSGLSGVGAAVTVIGGVVGASLPAGLAVCADAGAAMTSAATAANWGTRHVFNFIIFSDKISAWRSITEFQSAACWSMNGRCNKKGRPCEKAAPFFVGSSIDLDDPHQKLKRTPAR